MHSMQPSHQRRRTRKERLFRFAARRNTCISFALITSFMSCILLAASLLVVYGFIRPAKERLKVALAQEAIFNSYAGTPVFPGCTYTHSSYSTELCSNCYPSAYVIRKWQAEEEDLIAEGKCWNKFETVNCSDDHMNCAQIEYDEIKQCAGTKGIGMGNLKITQPNVMVPLIDLRKKEGEILHVKEIFAICPTCHVYSRSYRRKAGEKCRKRILTMNSGWPETFDLCDGSFETNEEACETYS